MLKLPKLKGRRNFLLGLAAVASMGTLATISKYWKLWQAERKVLALGEKNRDFTLGGDVPLRDRAAAKGLIYGAASHYGFMTKDAEFANRLAQECAMLVPEDSFKWKTIRPTPNSFNFKSGDWMVQFARNHGLLLRGSPLIWRKDWPAWFETTINRQNAESIMLKHIETVARRYAGKLHSWDVVNEAIHPVDGRSDGLRKTVWLEHLGSDYIEMAFRAAAEADPQALLLYNETGLDYDNPEEEARRVAVLQLLERLKSNGTPVHALGIQAHLRAEKKDFNPTKLQKFIRDVASLGLKVLVTEMDVSDRKLPSDIVMRDRIVAGVYEDYLSVVVNEPSVIAVITWGLSDRYTWLSKFGKLKDGSSIRPLPLDTELRRKLAWNAIALAFDRAPNQKRD